MGEKLWCVHTIGPDDVNAAPDFDTAEQWASAQNRMMREYTQARGYADDPNWPEVRSVVALWPYDAASHAADLPRSIASFTVPTRGEDARLREALEPFLKVAEPILHNDRERWDPDEWLDRLKHLTVGQFRELTRAALQGDAAHTSQEKGE